MTKTIVDGDVAAVGGQHVLAQQGCLALADGVQDQIVALLSIRELLLGVIDHRVRAERLHPCQVTGLCR